MKNMVLHIENLNKSFKEGNGYYIDVIKNVSLNVHSGEFILIKGPSGSGKTTLLSMIGCLMPVTSGKILINDIDILSISQNKLAKFRLKNIGFVFQSFRLLNFLKAIDNVSLALKLSHVKNSVAQKESARLLDEVGINHKADYLPDKLSSGEKQRVAIARALVTDPDLILADEPTGSLDSHAGQNIIELLSKLTKKKNKTIIVASHDERIIKYADRLFRIEDGFITEN